MRVLCVWLIMSGVPIWQVVVDVGSAKSCVRWWVHKAEWADGPKAVSESGELGALKRRIQVFEQG